MRFEGRILSVDQAVAYAYGSVVARREALGRPIGVIDAFVAATARVHALTVVTRDTLDFESTVADTLNPWTHDE